jgi:hypothetical protein
MVTLPEATPVTTPPDVIVAVAAGPELLHEPVPVTLLNEMVAPPAHTPVGPVIGDGSGFTVIVVKALQPILVE